MLLLEEIQTRLACEKNLSKVARGVGCTATYLWYIAHGQRVNPSYAMLKKISDYLEQNNA